MSEDKPLLIFDGDCRFCRAWVARWRHVTEDRVDYAPSQEVASRFPEIPPERFSREVILVEPDGSVTGGAHAVFRALSYAPGHSWQLALYHKMPGVAPLAELLYSLVAAHRPAFSRLTGLLWGPHVDPPTFLLSRSLFLRGLGIVYLIAFLSFYVQAPGLVGSRGILPAEGLLALARESLGAERYWLLPTICWISASDAAISTHGVAGALLAILLILGVAPRLVLAALWALYLSLCTIGGDFMEFQWDVLLLETGLLAILFAPGRGGRQAPALRSARFLLWFLLFKLMLGSGLVKLLSGDEVWWNLTALTIHYQTQPLPTIIGWWAHQLPAWFQKLSCAVMFFIELALPFLFFAPRRPRILAAFATIAFQVAIMATGNYTFFNILTIVLCVPLLDDAFLRRIASPPQGLAPDGGGQAPALRAIAAALFLLSAGALAHRVGLPVPGILLSSLRSLAPLRSINAYGLFADMTETRPEIIIEGSDDGRVWKAYEFRYKPGPPMNPPRWVEPHQPRLDWQMWFAALGSYRSHPWFINLMVRLHQGSPEVLALIEKNPFPERPPRHVRAVLYEYRFSKRAERRETGAWWVRRELGPYAPVISRR